MIGILDSLVEKITDKEDKIEQLGKKTAVIVNN